MSRLRSAARGLSDEETMKLIVDGIDKTLGDGTSRLLFKTFQLIYHEDVFSLPLRLDYLEVLTKKVLGKKVGQVVFHEIIFDINKFKGKTPDKRIKN